MRTSKEVADSAIRDAQERASNPKELLGYSWGIGALDRATRGIQPGRMNVLISRPKVGKSSLANGFMLEVAGSFIVEGSDKVVKLFAFEMTAAQVQQRLACQMADVPMWRVETGFYAPGSNQLQRYSEAQQTLALLPIEYHDTRLTMSQIEAEVHKENTGFWILDHIGLVADLAQAQNPYVEMGRLSGRVQQLCQKVCSGLIITHQNRASMGNTDKRPTMESISGSDGVAKDADLILGLWREDIGTVVSEADKNLPKPGELIIIANRHGDTYGIEMIFDPQKALWVERKQIETKPALRLVEGMVG